VTWQECAWWVSDAFVARLLEGEEMAILCREFDISRKTGYKIFQRYKARKLWMKPLPSLLHLVSVPPSRRRPCSRHSAR